MGVTSGRGPPLRLVAEPRCYSLCAIQGQSTLLGASKKEVPTVCEHFPIPGYQDWAEVSGNALRNVCDFISELNDTFEFLRLNPHVQKWELRSGRSAM